MPKRLEPLEISDIPELLRLAEEVAATGATRPLRRSGRDVAIIAPVEVDRAGEPWANYDPDVARAAIDAAASSWADRDVDAIIEQIYRARAEGSRPADRP